MENGINTYEDRIKNPSLDLLDFQYLNNHPEAKIFVYQKYVLDIEFKWKIKEICSLNPVFKENFNECFKNYLNQKGTKSR